MSREEIYSACQTALTKSNVLLLEAATGTGKSRTSILLINWIASTVYKSHKPKILLLVAKRVHKQTWKDEIEKWGGINADITMECYESLHKHTRESFDFLLMDEVHHVQSDVRLEALKTIKYGYMIGLSATIPQKLKMYFKYKYHAEIVSCDLIEAIDSEVLPEPTILLFPLQLENTKLSETIELNPKAKGPVVYGEYKDYWKLKKSKQHAFISCTQKQKLMDLDKSISWYKDKAMVNPAMKQTWLYLCGRRLEFLADYKLPWVKLILHHLEKERTITFCKTIEQTEKLGKYCIHSKNGKLADKYYNDFNQKKINHITAVNILNENANLVDCKYAVFCNLSSSDLVVYQRLGRSLRHKAPIIIMPYYEGTREQELIEKLSENFNMDYIKVIHSINEI